MPTISGSVLFNSVNQTPTSGTGVSNVPIVLRNTSGLGVVVLTDSSGNYTINNVPNGTYTLVEAWGTSGGVASPADFNTAVAIAAPTPADPPISAMPSPPAQANLTQSLSPNTKNLTVSANLTGQNFVDGPVQDIPIKKVDITTIGNNLITAADNGTWGSWPAGTAQGTAPATAPYPTNVPGFTYILPTANTPGDGQYSVLNMSNYSTFGGNWYNTSDHTTRNETGRYFLAGASGSAVIFTQTVTVKPNTYYMFSGWVMNPVRVLGTIPSQLTIKVTGGSGQILYQQSLLSIQPQIVLPQWNESSTLFNTGSNTTITFEMMSTGAVGGGNDYIIDDLLIQEVNVSTIMSSTKTVDKINADIGDILTYTVVLQNIGQSTITNIVFSDTIPPGTSFNSGSVQINGTTVAGANPTPPGFTLTTPVTLLRSGGLITLSFKTTVNTIPSPNPLSNSATTKYDFIPIPGGATVTETVPSNAVLTSVNRAQVPTSKSRDLAFVTIGDIITYTIPVTNTGSTTAINTILKDTIPNGTTFVTDSVIVDNVPQVGANPSPPSGLSLGTILVNQTKTVSFKVRVTSTPTPNPIPNSANVSYDYVVDPSVPTTKSSSTNTNIVTSQFNLATLSSSKTVNKSFANVGDTLNYTIILSNSGNTTATSILFIDTIPNGTSLVPGSFTQNGTAVSGSPNPPGVTLPINIPANSTSTISFSVLVNTIPTPNPIPNSATSGYSYLVDPSTSRNINSSIDTNTVTTQINNANLSNLVKGVNKQFSQIGDIITYTITIPNIGNVTANNVVFKDTIPSGTSFVVNSVVLNGSSQSGAVVAPPTGLSVGSIAPSSTATLSFQVTVTTIPTPNPIPNSGNVTYNYTVDPVLGTSVSKSNNTNIVSTTINSAVINSTKKVTPTNCVIGDTIFYTVILTNSGNATANNVTFIDTIPNDTTFVTNSLSLNGTSQPGQSPAPPNGFNVGSIAPNGVATLTFSVTADTIPSPNPIPNSSYTNYNFVLNPTTGETSAKTSLSNTVSTFVNPESNPLKIVDKQYAKPGDTLIYTVQWENKLNVTATDVTFIDTIPNDTTFVPNSMTIDGVTIPGAIPSPPTGINIGTIPSGVFTTVTFKVIVNTIPNPNPIPNQAIGRYSYISDPTLSIITTETAASNIVTTQVNYASIPSATKSVDLSFAKVSDILTYTISFSNTGNTTANNITLIDTIPNGTSFVVNSVFVNGVNQPGAIVAPPSGLSVGSLGSGSTATVVFKVTVTTVPSPNPIPNIANIGYNYIIDPITSRTDSGGTNTNIASTTVNYANLGVIGKTVDKTFANTSDTLLYTITIRNTGNVTANGVIISDTIPNNTSFVNSSVLINGVSSSTVPTGNILSVNMGNVAPNGVSSLTFRVQITGPPNPNPIPNSATANYTYTVDPAIPNNQNGANNTNIVNTQVNAASLGSIIKFVDKTFVTCGDIITYTISIPNTGNITANNVVFIDTVPNGTVLVPSSILVNGVVSSATSPLNVPLGSINPGSTTTVSFKVVVQC